MKFARGFYAVLDREDERLARTLAAHADVLQVRIKPGDAVDVLRVARMARVVCDDAGIALFVNDRVDLALAAKADGVHLGQTDLPIAEARRLAPQLKIGITPRDAERVFTTGAAAICAIASVNAADDVGAAARCLWRRGVAGFATGE